MGISAVNYQGKPRQLTAQENLEKILKNAEKAAATAIFQKKISLFIFCFHSL